MTPTAHRPAPIFVGDNLALDFLNSVVSPRADLIDSLETEAGLLDWLDRAGIFESAELERLGDESQADELTEALRAIREFRDDFREFIQTSAGRDDVPSTHPLIAKVNDILRGGSLMMQMTPSPQDQSEVGGQTRALVLSTQYEMRGPSDILPRIAAICARLICEADFICVRNCEGPTCTIYFLDVSKNRKRRWCSMSICGNRAKAAAHRKAKAASSQA